ncbi:MAG: hypothetical protein IJT16_04000 [Lachnospiraceae bacterium]|nr:hypothetical protein [Lachnospiraceae bacterium]
MKKTLVSNLSLKIISVIAAFILWMVVVNTDDPMITRTYSGIAVEVINTDDIESQGKTWEVLENSDTISVIVHAKRSVIEDMSRDYIRATADMKEITAMNAIPIDVRSTRYSDRIDSLTPVTKNVRVEIEDLGVKRIGISAETTGAPLEGYVIGTVTPAVNILTVSGPVSRVERVDSAKAVVDVTGLSGNVSTNAPVNLYDEAGNIVLEDSLSVNVTEVHVDIKIYDTKLLPISLGKLSGSPADGFQVSGTVRCEPDSVRVAGSASSLEALESLVIPSEELSVAGASQNVVRSIDASKYLPTGVAFADPEFDGMITVTIYIGGLTTKEVSVPIVNISITNVPEGYSAVLAESGAKTITVSGLSDTLRSLDANSITGVINASAMSLKEGSVIIEGSMQGSYNGEVALNLPGGVSVTGPVYLEVVLSPIASSVLPEAAGETIEEPAITQLVDPTVDVNVDTPVVPDMDNQITEMP